MSGYRVDFTDTRILKLLAKDCRVSYRQIALNLDITTNTVKRRINNLVSRRIIADFLIRVNLGAFGYKNIHNLTIKHKGNRDQIEKYLRNLGYVFQEGSCVGGISRFVLASKERVDDELKSIPEKYRCVQQIDNFIGLWDSDFFFIVNDLQILRCLIRDPRMKTKDIAHAIHVSQKTVKRRIDIMLFNRVIDFTIFVNPMEVKGYINVGVFIEIGKEGREKAIGEIYEEIKNLLVLESPYQGLNTIGLNLYVENMWEIERVQNKAESMKAVRNVSIVLPLRRRYSHEQLLKEIDKRITKALS